jgi:hypothetical protein
LSVALTLTGICMYGQNLIGYKYMEIKKYMKENRTEMNINDVTNHKFKYLKYSDTSDSQTLLFFLDPDSVCKSVRIICDVSLKAAKKKEFDTIYKKTGENKWTDSRAGKNYLVELKEEEWSSVITIEPDK